VKKVQNHKGCRQIVVPRALRQDVLKLCHDNFTGAHLGEKKPGRFFWPNAYKDTLIHVNCQVCEKLKNPKLNRAELQPITDFDKPFDVVAMDVLELSYSSNGYKYVIVFSDYLTRSVEAFPMKDQKAETIARIFINEIYTRHGAPKRLLSDQGKNFLSNIVKEICKYFDIGNHLIHDQT
jgi:hypothetical protein